MSAAVFTGVGEMLKPHGGTAGFLFVKAAVHGVVGGALSAAKGGGFLQGFAANAIGAAAGFAGSESGAFGAAGDGDFGLMLARTAIAGAAGCAGASVTGGKCADGAVTAAFAHIYNYEGLARFQATNAGNAVAEGATSSTCWLWRAFTPIASVALVGATLFVPDTVFSDAYNSLTGKIPDTIITIKMEHQLEFRNWTHEDIFSTIAGGGQPEHQLTIPKNEVNQQLFTVNQMDI